MELLIESTDHPHLPLTLLFWERFSVFPTDTVKRPALKPGYHTCATEKTDSTFVHINTSSMFSVQCFDIQLLFLKSIAAYAWQLLFFLPAYLLSGERGLGARWPRKLKCCGMCTRSSRDVQHFIRHPPFARHQMIKFGGVTLTHMLNNDYCEARRAKVYIRNSIFKDGGNNSHNFPNDFICTQDTESEGSG